MKVFNFHYNAALNSSTCDTSIAYQPYNNSLNTAVLPAYFHFDGLYPPTCARTVFGHVVPPLALFVLAVNIIIIIIFAKSHIRSHTTFILTIIAVSDSLNICVPSILYVYYYTLGNHKDYVPYKLCFATYTLMNVLPDMFNLISVWSTILLACIRFRCLQSPFKARELHTNSRIGIGVTFVLILAMSVQLPTLAMFDFIPVNVTSLVTNHTMETCVVTTAKALNTVCAFREIHIWVELFANSFIPCFALITLDIAIWYTLRKASIRRLSLHSCGTPFKFNIRRKSSVVKYCSNGSKRPRTYCEEDNDIDNMNSTLHTESNQGNLRDELPPNSQRNQPLNEKRCTRKTISETFLSCNSSSGKQKQHKYLRKSSSAPIEQHGRLKRFSSIFIPSRLISFNHQHFDNHRQSNASKFHKTASFSNEVSYKRLAKESKRTSWMIFAVVAIICTHELLYGILFANKMIHNVGPIPVNFFGCGTVYLNLWQYITYPLIFLIYCFMSAAFRLELRDTLCCFSTESAARPTYARNSVFMSPCSVRKSVSLSSNEKGCHEELIEHEI